MAGQQTDHRAETVSVSGQSVSFTGAVVTTLLTKPPTALTDLSKSTASTATCRTAQQLHDRRQSQTLKARL